MTAGNGTPASHEFAHVAQRLASFAAGCTSSPAKTGNRLGVMGSVSEAELHEILHHIEVLSRQRAVGLAGQSGGYPESESQTERSHGSSFRQALQEACGVDADHIHLYLPKDSVGKVDLMQIFRMEDGKAAAAPVPEPSFDAFADFVDDPSDLPKATEMPKLSDEVDQAKWLQDTVAINALRSALVHKMSIEVADVLLPLSKRCRSRRPALSKTALRALAELAAADEPAATGHTDPDTDPTSTSPWMDGAMELVANCLSAMQVTKVTAKMGEETLNALCGRLQKEANTAKVLQVLCGLQCPEVRQPGHPICVAAMLRVMGNCLRSGGVPSGDDADATSAASAFCEEVLKTRRLSPAFSEARAVLRQLAPTGRDE